MMLIIMTACHEHGHYSRVQTVLSYFSIMKILNIDCVLYHKHRLSCQS